MQELKATVVAAFDKIVADGTIQKAIEKSISETIVDALTSSLKTYSDFGKQVKEEVAKALQVDFSNLGLPGYNDLVLKLVRQTVAQHTDTALKQQLETQMSNLLAPAPETITLSKLVADFKEKNVDRYSCSCDSPDRITLIVEQTSYGSRWIFMDQEDGKEKYECDVKFLWREETGHISALQFDRKNVDKTLFVGLYGFEQDIFQMHAAGTRLVIDCDPEEIDTYYPGHGD